MHTKHLDSMCAKNNMVYFICFNIQHKSNKIIEPPHGKTNNLHRRKQRRRSASRLHREADHRLAVTAKLIIAFVFATPTVQFLFYLNPKFQASRSFLLLCRPVCVRPIRKPHCWFSHEAAQINNMAKTLVKPGYKGSKR